MEDKDLIAGRKAILDFLKLASWGCVEERIKDGLPVAKIGGRWEMSVTAYRTWKEKIFGLDGTVTERTESSMVNVVIREFQQTEQVSTEAFKRLENAALEAAEKLILSKINQLVKP